jgi:thioredoxin-related protein
MKKLFIFVLSLVIMTSCAPQKMVRLVDGTYISQKQYKRISHKNFKDAMKSISKEDKKLILGSDVSFEYEIK